MSFHLTTGAGDPATLLILEEFMPFVVLRLGNLVLNTLTSSVLVWRYWPGFLLYFTSYYRLFVTLHL